MRRWSTQVVLRSECAHWPQTPPSCWLGPAMAPWPSGISPARHYAGTFNDYISRCQKKRPLEMKLVYKMYKFSTVCNTQNKNYLSNEHISSLSKFNSELYFELKSTLKDPLIRTNYKAVINETHLMQLIVGFNGYLSCFREKQTYLGPHLHDTVGTHTITQ